jgi:DNA-binding YbaB/EbfC family protein
LSEKVQFNYKNTGIIYGSEEKMSMAKGLGNMMRQAQMMQQKMARLQDELASQEVEASAGGGMVVARVTGKQQVVAIKIDPAAVDPEDLDMLQDLVVAAVNEAIKKSQDLVQQEMSKITGGMNIPGLF